MARQLQINYGDEDDDLKTVGAYDPSTSWEEFEDGKNDEELARRLQMAEYDPNPKPINSSDDYSTRITPSQRSNIEYDYMDAQRRNAELRRKQTEQEYEQKLQIERAELQKERDLHRQKEREQEHRLVAERTERQRVEREHEHERNARRALSDLADYADYTRIARASYPLSYDRIYNWGLTLLPNYYDYETKIWLRNQLSKLIRREILLHSSESELEDKIRRLINDAEYDAMKKKESLRDEDEIKLIKTESIEKKSKSKSTRRAKSKAKKSKRAAKSKKKSKNKQNESIE